MKKRVGLVIDSKKVSKQTYDFIQQSLGAKNYSITTLVIHHVNARENRVARVLSKIKAQGLFKVFSDGFFDIVCQLESLKVKGKRKFRGFYDTFELSDTDYETISVQPRCSNNDSVYEYSKIDLETIKNAELDLLIHCGDSVLSGEILTICPHGVIAFHHADADINRHGLVGFWEVYHKNPRTGFVIQRLTNDSAGGDILYKGYVPTSTSYGLNVAKLYEMSNPFLHRVIEDITSAAPTLTVHEKTPYNGSCHCAPNFVQTLHYLCQKIGMSLGGLPQKIMGKKDRWGVAYQFTESWNDVTLSRSIKIPNPKNRFLADPFLIKRQGKHYCFVEDYDYSTRKAFISVYEISKDASKDLGIALIEDCHLSYPYIFEYDNELYMCPETYQKGEIRLYKCDDFPLKWTYHKTIMSAVSAADTTIFFRDDRWWLFTNIDLSSVGEHASQLHIFHSSNPLSDNWIPHKHNPVIFDSLKGRNGGFIQDHTGSYRVYQRQGFDNYGEAFGVAKIESLSANTYVEKPLFEVEPRFFPNIKGTHTYNYCEGLLVFDYVETAKKKTGAVSNKPVDLEQKSAFTSSSQAAL